MVSFRISSVKKSSFSFSGTGVAVGAGVGIASGVCAGTEIVTDEVIGVFISSICTIPGAAGG